MFNTGYIKIRDIEQTLGKLVVTEGTPPLINKIIRSDIKYHLRRNIGVLHMCNLLIKSLEGTPV